MSADPDEELRRLRREEIHTRIAYGVSVLILFVLLLLLWFYGH